LNNWNIRSTYISTIISISLVLLMIGLIGIVMINAKQLSDDFKKNIKYSVYLKNNLSESEVLEFTKEINANPYVFSATFKSKEEAAEELKKELNAQDENQDDPYEILDGQIPLPNSIDLKFLPEFSNPDSLEQIKAQLEQENEVRELVFHGNLIHKIHKNSNTITIYLLAISAVLMIVALALINNTIKLTVYSKRFIIRTMQLVGATSRFILGPFLFSAILQGFISGVLAVVMLIGFLRTLQNQLPDLARVENQEFQLILFAGIVVVGILFSLVSTWFAVRKYLRKNLDQLTLG
jgi:cell division transport system permease protein